MDTLYGGQNLETQLADLMMGLLAKRQADPGMVRKADGTPDITNYLYQSGGLFGTCDADRTLINAMVGPVGYEAVLQWFGTNYVNEITDTLVGVESTTDAQATICGDCGTTSFKKCAQGTCLGRICQMTPEMVIDEIGQFAHANIPTKALFGPLTDAAGRTMVPQGGEIKNEWALAVAGAGYSLALYNSTDMWSGNPAANTAGRWYMTGFDLLINTGKIDLRSGLACDAMDSIIVNYNNQIVGAAGSTSIVDSLASVIRSIRFRIQGMRLQPNSATIDIVMHPVTFDCFAAAYACEYGLTCQSFTANTGTSNNIDSVMARDRANAVIATQVINIDGRPYKIYLDSQMPITNGSVGSTPVRCGEIAVITRVLPGAPKGSASPGGGIITWGEYQDFRRTAGDTIAWLKQETGGTHFDITDGGRFIVTRNVHGTGCFDARILTKTRVRLSMPQLAGRITNVCCNPLGTYPDVSGSGGAYEVDGGASTSPEAYPYGPCWPTHVGS